MRTHYVTISLLVGLVMALTYPVRAAVVVPLYQASFEKIRQNFHFSLANSIKTANDNADSLVLINEIKDNNAIIHVRMQQYFSGIPVFGGYAIMHSNNSAKNLTYSPSMVQMTGMLYSNLQDELGQFKPDFIKKAPAILLKFKEKYLGNLISEEQISPIIYVDNSQHAHWAYKLSLLIQSPNAIPQKPNAIIDAMTLQPFVHWDDIKTKKSVVRGMGYGGNLKTGQYQYGSDLPYLQMYRTSDELCSMENKDVIVTNMNHKYLVNKEPIIFPCPERPNNPEAIFTTGQNADGYDEFNGAFSPSNDALYAGNIVKNMYYDWYQIPVLKESKGKTAMPLIMRVHYGSNYQNAYWDGKQMTFGDGGKELYPLVSLDVAAHEISHGFTEQHSDLAYYGESGGINEAFSDMAAQAALYYASGKNNWQIGASIMKNRKALRYLDRPSLDGKSYDTAEEYYAADKMNPGSIEVHSASGVFNHLFYILANKVNWNVHKAFDIMIRANMYYWGPYDNFKQASCGLLYAAKDLNYSVDDVKKSLDEIVIDYRLCES